MFESDPELEALLQQESDPWSFCLSERRPYHGRNQVWSPLKLRVGMQVVVHLYIEHTHRDHTVTIADIDDTHVCFEEWKNWYDQPDWYHLADLGVISTPGDGRWHKWHYMALPETASVAD